MDGPKPKMHAGSGEVVRISTSLGGIENRNEKHGKGTMRGPVAQNVHWTSLLDYGPCTPNNRIVPPPAPRG